MDILIDKTIDNGTIENVHIAPIGDFYGSKADGSAIEEHITLNSLQRIADDLNANNEEVLMDIDHQSTREGNKKNTSAVGWFHKFVVDPVKGLFANLKLTKMGKELIENREYRYVSPTFSLDENGEPSMLHSVGATNLPAFKGSVKPILNTEAKEISTINKDILNMTTEELTTLIKETVKNELQMLNTCADKKTEEVKNEEVKEENKEEIEKIKEEVKEELKSEEIKEEVNEEIKEEVNGDVKEEEVKEELRKALNEEEKKEDKKEEVIKMEVLNSAPAPQMEKTEPWKALRGEQFFKYLREHPEVYTR